MPAEQTSSSTTVMSEVTTPESDLKTPGFFLKTNQRKQLPRTMQGLDLPLLWSPGGVRDSPALSTSWGMAAPQISSLHPRSPACTPQISSLHPHLPDRAPREQSSSRGPAAKHEGSSSWEEGFLALLGTAGGHRVYQEHPTEDL